jgi:hypothetical protein
MLDRLDLCLSACQMLSYWHSRNLFCWDFQPAVIGATQFASSFRFFSLFAPSGVDMQNRIVKLVDVTKLMTPPEGDACATDRQCVPPVYGAAQSFQG